MDEKQKRTVYIGIDTGKVYALPSNQQETQQIEGTTVVRTKENAEVKVRVVFDFILPEIAVVMAEKSLFFITGKELLSSLQERWWGQSNDSLQEAEKDRVYDNLQTYYGYQISLRDVFQKQKMLNAEQLLTFVSEVSESQDVFEKNSEDVYSFNQQQTRDSFVATGLINRFLCAIAIGKTFTATMETAGKENNGKENNDKQNNDKQYNDKQHNNIYAMFHQQKKVKNCLKILERDIWSDEILSIIGEKLGIHHTLPYFENGKWLQKVNENPVFDRLWEVCRWKIAVEEGSESEEFEEKILQEQQDWESIHHTLLRIIKLGRMNCGRSDLSGIDFTGIFMKKPSVSGCILSRPSLTAEIEIQEEKRKNEGNVLCSKNGVFAKLSELNSWRSHQSFGRELVSLNLHPFEEKAVLVWESEIDNMLIEEMDFHTKEIRSYGAYRGVKQIQYSEGGQSILFVQEYKKMVTVCDRITGVKKEFSIPVQSVFRMKCMPDKTTLMIMGVLKPNEKERLCVAILKLNLESGEVQIKQICDWWYKGTEYSGDIVDEQTFFVMDKKSLAKVDVETEEIKTLYYEEIDEICSFAVNPQKKQVFLLNKTGQMMEIALDAENVKLRMMPDGSSKEDDTSIHVIRYFENKVFILTKHAIYVWDCQQEVWLPSLFHGIDLEKKRGCMLSFSVGRTYSLLYIWDNRKQQSQYRLFDSISGEILQDETIKKSKYTGILTHMTVCEGNECRLTVLDKESRAVYFYQKEPNGGFLCIGYSFPDLDWEHSCAIYTDWNKGYYRVCDNQGICTYRIDTGNKKQDESFLPFCEEIQRGIEAEKRRGDCLFSIKQAEFSVDGTSLLLQISYLWEQEFPVHQEMAHWEWEYQTGSLFLYETIGEGKRIQEVYFGAEDIKTGYAGTERYLVITEPIDKDAEELDDDDFIEWEDEFLDLTWVQKRILGMKKWLGSKGKTESVYEDNVYCLDGEHAILIESRDTNKDIKALESGWRAVPDGWVQIDREAIHHYVIKMEQIPKKGFRTKSHFGQWDVGCERPNKKRETPIYEKIEKKNEDEIRRRESRKNKEHRKSPFVSNIMSHAKTKWKEQINADDGEQIAVCRKIKVK